MLFMKSLKTAIQLQFMTVYSFLAGTNTENTVKIQLQTTSYANIKQIWHQNNTVFFKLCLRCCMKDALHCRKAIFFQIFKLGKWYNF